MQGFYNLIQTVSREAFFGKKAIWETSIYQNKFIFMLVKPVFKIIQ